MEGEAVAATIEYNQPIYGRDLANRGLGTNADELKKTLDMIHSFLGDADKKFISDESVKKWLKELEAAAFGADNLSDELNYYLLSKRMNPEKQKVHSCFPYCNHYVRRRQMAVTIEQIDRAFRSIRKNAMEIGLERRLADAPVVTDYSASETNSFSLDPIFIGRDDVLEIVKMLITFQTEEMLSVLTIVGMGGLGKTTLTRRVFRHQNIKTHFGERIWVHVRKKLDPVSLLKGVLTNLTPQKIDGECSEVILKKLQQALGEKTYLLVLDDVWKQNQPKW